MNLPARNDDLRDFFAARSAGYDDVHAKFAQTKAVLTEALPDGTARVLDLGAGTGLELIPLFARFPDARVTAVDLCDEMLDILRSRPFAGRVDCICGSFFDVDFGCGYDAVISTSALHHFAPADKLRLYAKVCAALRPGGLFLNSDEIAMDDAEEAMLFRRLAENDGSYAHVDTPLTIEHECGVLREAGFAQVTVGDAHRENYRLFAARRP